MRNYPLSEDVPERSRDGARASRKAYESIDLSGQYEAIMKIRAC